MNDVLILCRVLSPQSSNWKILPLPQKKKISPLYYLQVAQLV